MKAAVIGGGFAGLVAALELVERGHAVVLLERRGVLGGRATSYRDAQSGDEVDTGTHVLAGGCSATRAALARFGAADLLAPGAPWPSGARHAVLTLLLNERPERVDPLLLAQVEREWLEPAGVAPLLFRAGLRAVHERLAERLRAAGGVIRLRALAERIDVRPGHRLRVRFTQRAATREAIRSGARASAERVEADVVIAAVPWHVLPELADPELRARAPFRDAAALPARPAVSLEAWCDGPAPARTLTQLGTGPIEWVVDKGALHGRQGPPRHFGLVVTPDERGVERSNAAWTALATEALAAAAAPAAAAPPKRVLVLREPTAFFACDAESNRLRPPAETGIPGLLLAGDWTAGGLPPCIEGAVRSGLRAAEAASAAGAGSPS